MRGEMARALGGLKDLYDGGADPAAVLVALAEFVHLVTRLKLAPEAVEDAAITPEERARGAGFAARLSMPVLTRAWQLLSKGLQEVKDSDRPLAAADMVLVRLAYAADLPTPDEALRKLAALTDDFSTPGAGIRRADRRARRRPVARGRRDRFGRAPGAAPRRGGGGASARARRRFRSIGRGDGARAAARRSGAGYASFDLRRCRGAGRDSTATSN